MVTRGRHGGSEEEGCFDGLAMSGNGDLHVAYHLGLMLSLHM